MVMRKRRRGRRTDEGTKVEKLRSKLGQGKKKKKDNYRELNQNRDVVFLYILYMVSI